MFNNHTSIVRYLAWCIVSIAAASAAAQRNQSLKAARDQMVERAVIGGGVRDTRVLKAMRDTPRHEFVPQPQRRRAYYDMSLPIGGGQTISPPYVVAFMTERLEPKPTDRVLEIGTGSGYQAAILSHLVSEVYTIEIVESLGKRARQTLRRLGMKNVHTKIGDGYQGWPEHAPFDKIIVTCSPESIPAPLVDQLTEGGRMVIPLGERFQQSLYLFRKVDGKLEKEALEPTFFVPMTGQAESERELQIDERIPQLRHTSFEKAFDDSGAPIGWFYARQTAVTDQFGATQGKFAVSFQNDEPGRPAHIMQAFGVNGKFLASIRLRVDAQGIDLAKGRGDDEVAGVLVEFYGPNRRPVGSRRLTEWSGSFDWTNHGMNFSVPQSAQLAIVGVGLFGGTGTLVVDNIQIESGKARGATRVVDN